MSDGTADWGLYKNPIDTIGSTLAAGQDRAFLQQQRAFQSQQNAASLAATQRTQAAIPTITTALGQGDYNGAEIAAAVSGNKDLASTITGLHDRHRQQLQDYAGTIGSIAQGLKAIPLGVGGDDSARASAFASQVAALRSHGATVADIRAATAGGFGDNALDGYINSATTVQQHIDNANKAQELALKGRELDKPVTVGEGSSLVNPVTGQPLYTAPAKPEAKVVKNADGSESLVPITYGTGGAAVGAAPSVAAIGNGSTRPERNNNPGNVKALPNGQQWRGQTGVDDQGYAIFGDQVSGQRAADRNLQSYARKGINTVSGIVSRWAPKADRNNTDAYIASVSRALGVAPNQPLDLSDPSVRQALLTKGIFPNEGPVGRQPNAPHPISGSAGVSFGTPYTPPNSPAAGGAGTGAGGLSAQAIELAAREGLAQGGKVPAGYARNKAAQAAITNRMAEINAGGDVQGLINRGQDQKGAQAMVVDMARGASGKTVQAGNVAVEHLAQLHDAAIALQNGNVPLFNRISLTYQRATGSALPTTAEALRGVVSNEIQKAVSGSAGALHDREDLNNQLNVANSPAQIQGIIKGYIGLMGSQIHGVRTRYEAATGRQDFSKYVSPIAAKVLGLNRGGGAAQPVQVNSPADAARLPAGTRFRTPDGRIIVKH